MPIPKNKKELLEAIQKDYDNLIADFNRIPLNTVNERSMPGHAIGTFMSPKDLVSYLVGWLDLVLLWHKQSQEGIDIIFPCEGFKWNELGLLAQKFYKDYENHNFSSLLNLLDQNVNEIIALVKHTDNDILYGQAWYKKYTMGRMIQLNTSSPFKNARKRIRKEL